MNATEISKGNKVDKANVVYVRNEEHIMYIHEYMSIYVSFYYVDEADPLDSTLLTSFICHHS